MTRHQDDPELGGPRESLKFGVRHQIELRRGIARPGDRRWTEEDDAMWVHLHLSALRHGANGCRAFGYDRIDGGAHAAQDGGEI